MGNGDRIIVFLVFLTLVLLYPFQVVAQDQVKLQLKWTHAFQFAGYYAAKELGYYENLGLDVEIVEASPNVDPIEEVVAGRAHFGVGNTSLLIARQAGKPVVVLNVVFQHSPAVIISRGGSFPSLKDLSKKRIMIEPNSAELYAYLAAADVDVQQLEVMLHSYQVDDLIEGKVDAISAYSSYEPYLLNAQGFYFHMFTPREVGVDFYGDNLFTSELEIAQNPERVEAFRTASMQGWEYAMQHPEEIIELIVSKYAPQKDPKHLEFEAQKMKELLVHDLVSVGHMNLHRWQRIVEVYQSLGQQFRTDILEGFIYKPYVSLWVTIRHYQWFLMLVALLIVGLVYRNIELKRFNRKLEYIANRDQLTGVFNRKYLDEVLISENKRRARYGNNFSVIIADVDDFKEVNDRFGHYVGDDVLRALVGVLQTRIRATDTLGRWGGEEFMLICPETELGDAINLADSLRQCLEEQTFKDVGQVTASFGVASSEGGMAIDHLIKNADDALYKAKHQGRNRVYVHQ